MLDEKINLTSCSIRIFKNNILYIKFNVFKLNETLENRTSLYNELEYCNPTEISKSLLNYLTKVCYFIYVNILFIPNLIYYIVVRTIFCSNPLSPFMAYLGLYFSCYWKIFNKVSNLNSRELLTLLINLKNIFKKEIKFMISGNGKRKLSVLHTNK